MPVDKRLHTRLRAALDVSYAILRRAEELQWQTAYALRHSQTVSYLQRQDEQARPRTLTMEPNLGEDTYGDDGADTQIRG
jgi:hypothetical protein